MQSCDNIVLQDSIELREDIQAFANFNPTHKAISDSILNQQVSQESKREYVLQYW